MDVLIREGGLVLLKGPPLPVLCSIATHYNGQPSSSYPSLSTIMEETGYSRLAVWKAILFLEEVGLLEVERQQGKPNSYTLKTELVSMGLGNDVTQLDVNQATTLPTPGNDVTQQGNLTRQRRYPKEESGSGEEDTTKKNAVEFEEFMEIYTRKTDKAKAYRCWQTCLKEGYTPEQIIQAAKNYAAQCAEDGTLPKYTKLAATFLGPDKPFTEWIDGRPEPEPAYTGIPDAAETRRRLAAQQDKLEEKEES